MFEVDLSSSMGRHNFDDGATQLICRGDTTPMLGRRNFGWGDITWGDKAMGRHNLHSSKAFDTANHQILLNKLKYYRLQQSEYNWFQSYLSNRKQQCMQRTLLLIHVLSPLVCLMDRY